MSNHASVIQFPVCNYCMKPSETNKQNNKYTNHDRYCTVDAVTVVRRLLLPQYSLINGPDRPSCTDAFRLTGT